MHIKNIEKENEMAWKIGYKINRLILHVILEKRRNMLTYQMKEKREKYFF